MTDPVTIEISGLTELQEKIKRLPVRIARRIVYSSLRKGAAVVRNQARQFVPVRTGTLRKGFKVARSRIHRGPQQFGIYLTLKGGRGRSDPNDPYYGVFVERGWRRGNTNKPGVFFMKRALEQKYDAAVQAIVDDATAKTEQNIRELGL